MALNFNSKGYLHKTITLTYEEFEQHFGTNPKRMEQIKNALPCFRIFHSCGCQTVYVDGSFVSKKKYPEDIDICFDPLSVDKREIKKVFPQFYDINQRGRIRRDQMCHIFTLEKENTELFDLLNADRDGNPKGLVKLDLNEIIYYDQK
jgi:hypothetical protein